MMKTKELTKLLLKLSDQLSEQYFFHGDDFEGEDVIKHVWSMYDDVIAAYGTIPWTDQTPELETTVNQLSRLLNIRSFDMDMAVDIHTLLTVAERACKGEKNEDKNQ